jgi:hypothetical protein
VTSEEGKVSVRVGSEWEVVFFNRLTHWESYGDGANGAARREWEGEDVCEGANGAVGIQMGWRGRKRGSWGTT